MTLSRELPIIFHQQVDQHDLDLIPGKKWSGASMLAVTKDEMLG